MVWTCHATACAIIALTKSSLRLGARPGQLAPLAKAMSDSCKCTVQGCGNCAFQGGVFPSQAAVLVRLQQFVQSKTQTCKAQPAARATTPTPTCSHGLVALALFGIQTCISKRVTCASRQETPSTAHFPPAPLRSKESATNTPEALAIVLCRTWCTAQMLCSTIVGNLSLLHSYKVFYTRRALRDKAARVTAATRAVRSMPRHRPVGDGHPASGGKARDLKIPLMIGIRGAKANYRIPVSKM
jgi:hypothetical protein